MNYCCKKLHVTGDKDPGSTSEKRTQLTTSNLHFFARVLKGCKRPLSYLHIIDVDMNSVTFKQNPLNYFFKESFLVKMQAPDSKFAKKLN